MLRRLRWPPWREVLHCTRHAQTPCPTASVVRAKRLTLQLQMSGKLHRCKIISLTCVQAGCGIWTTSFLATRSYRDGSRKSFDCSYVDDFWNWLQSPLIANPARRAGRLHTSSR